MATANSALQVTELDFGNIRASLKTFMAAQSNFADYDFDGSNISTLLDILAYNTHYNAYYTNMVANESFLKSAQLRNNVIERAQELGYTPSSAAGAIAEVTITIVPTDSPDSISIPVNTQMTTVVDDITLTFTTSSGTLITKSGANTYVATGVTIAEGYPLTHTYTVDTGSPVEYVIPNKNVDTTRIGITVKPSAGSSTITTYTLADDITQLTGESTVYFLEETDDEQFRIYFGDDILGVSLSDGNQVIIDYHVCNTTQGNGASSFTNLSAIAGYSDVTIATTTSAAGGRELETVAAVKFNAPLYYERQNRVVTQGDYERVIMAENADFTSVNVWGGEDNDPPIYGRVYLAVNPSVGTIISDTRKEILVASLKTRNVMSIDPIVVDAEFLYVIPTVEIRWNPDLTTKNAGTIESEVAASIATYQTDTLDDFGNKFRFSAFSTVIDATDNSIRGNLSSVKMMMEITPTVSVATSYTIQFKNAILHTETHDPHTAHTGVIQSTSFTYLGFTSFLQDDGSGIIQIYRWDGGDKVILEAAAGTVNYDTGAVSLDAFNPTAVGNSGILEISITPTDNDITPTLAQIINIKDTTITSVEDRTV
jgi:hypothetical protein